VQADETIRLILAEHGQLSCAIGELGDDDDLFSANLTSHATVNVMLALEDAFGIEFPDDMMRKSNFQSVSAMRAAVLALAGASGGG